MSVETQGTPTSQNQPTVASVIPYTVADGGNPEPTGVSTITPNAKVYTDEDLSRVRAQEKSKLYPQIETLQQKLETLEKERDERIAAEKAERKRIEEEARKKTEEEMDVRALLERKESEWEQRLGEERSERERAFQLLQHERQFQEVAQYRMQRIDQERDTIMPELLDMVGGNSVEEVDASITGLKERTARILESAQQAMGSARQGMPGARVTSPPAGPLETNMANQPMTDDQVANLSFSDYVKNRTKLLGQASASRNSGIFG